jgi:hypothetical protein
MSAYPKLIPHGLAWVQSQAQVVKGCQYDTANILEGKPNDAIFRAEE